LVDPLAYLLHLQCNVMIHVQFAPHDTVTLNSFSHLLQLFPSDNLVNGCIVLCLIGLVVVHLIAPLKPRQPCLIHGRSQFIYITAFQ